MRRLSGLTLVVVVAILVSAAWAVAAGTATATYVYVVPGSTVPGLSTDVVLDPAASATITATGAICPYGGSFCPGPNGDAGWNTTGILYGGFPLPGAPAWGLLARVGSGPWVQVGSGPTTVAGTGVLEFAVNDDFLADNTGTFTVTVTVTSSTTAGSCKPGWGYGDKNHEHCGPPGLEDKPGSCKPGWGYGDKNHEHCGPPGLENKPEDPGQGPSGGEAGSGDTKGKGRSPGGSRCLNGAPLDER